MVIAAIIPIIACVLFGLLYILMGNGPPPASPTTAKAIALFMWFSVMAFLVVMLALSHDVLHLGRGG